MDYQVTGDKVEAAVKVATNEVRFIAQQISRAPTGIHARLTLALDHTILAYSYCNAERDEERVRLSNSAYHKLGPVISKLYPKELFKHDFDLFVWGLWEAWQSTFKSVEEAGDPLDMEPAFILKPYIMEGGGTILFSPPGRGKALDDETPVFTTAGWKRHGDLTAGDYVFGPDGNPKQVLHTRRNLPDRPAFTITFSNGERIVADAEHEWQVDCEKEYHRYRGHPNANPKIGRPRTTFRSFRHVREPEIVETQHLLVGQRRPPSINLAKPLKLPDRLLPIEPYALGVWLGDGVATNAYVSCGDQDIEHFRGLGKARRDSGGKNWLILIPGLQKAARSLNLIGNKHIPTVYFLSSLGQRLALLQGLMDTDGYIDMAGKCEFSVTSLQLARDAYRLIASVGLKCSFNEGKAYLKGRYISPRYRLFFYPGNLTVFRLARKLHRQVGTKSRQVENLYIKAVEPATPRSMQCIEVEGGLYLAGETLVPTHNSWMGLVKAICVDAGVDDFWPVQQTRVMFVNLERSWQSVRRRITAINQALGLDPARPLLCFHARGKSLADMREPVARDIKAKGVGLLVLDSLSRTGMGDLNENRPVNATIDALNALCPTWLALAHTPRGDESHIFGGIHFEAGADIVVQLQSQTTPKSLGLGLQVTKANDMRLPPQEVFRLSFNGFALTSFEKARDKEFGQIEKSKKQSLEQAVLEYLLYKEKASATETAEATGFSRTKVAMFLLNDARIIKIGKDGREVLYGVVFKDDPPDQKEG